MAKSVDQHFAHWLDATLWNLGWSNGDLAERIGVHDTAVGKWRRGRMQPEAYSVSLIAHALGLELPRLLLTAGYGDATPGCQRYPVRGVSSAQTREPGPPDCVCRDITGPSRWFLRSCAGWRADTKLEPDADSAVHRLLTTGQRVEIEG